MVAKCLEEICNTTPAFNYENEKERLYCKLHKKENMVNIKNRKCLEDNCKKQPSCNFEKELKAIYCFEHKKENMINIRSKKCIIKNCNTNPVYNLKNKKIAEYCREHAQKDMVDIIHKKCDEENCDKRSNYNYENTKIGIYCREHAQKDMVDIIHKKCIECKITRISNIRYNGHCLRCFMFKFPNEKVSKNYKIKENHMTDFIKKEFEEEIMIFDKQTGGCSRRRPDVYIDKYTHVVIIECDENQHNNEDYNSCNNKRTMELFQDFGNRPIVFIRFNPDNYISNNKKIKSCFKIHKTHGIPIINDKSNWNERLELLKETINKWLIEIPGKEITCEYLYFN